MANGRTTQRLLLTGKRAAAPLDPLKTGMPALDSIHDDKASLTKAGQTYRILKTTETDTYETTPTAVALTKALKGKKTPSPAAIAAATKPKAPTSENFAGADRKAAKLSIASAPMQNYGNVSALIASLPSVDSMVQLHIPTNSTSNRVQQEERNVHVTGFLYAASHEADNDFHLIVGDDPNAANEEYMTMEVSGLPPKNSPAFVALNAARTSFKQFFGAKNLPGAGYNFYQPPIPVVVEGSLFFDATHSTGQAPGPPSLKSRMPTIFEVHPVTSIKLGP